MSRQYSLLAARIDYWLQQKEAMEREKRTSTMVEVYDASSHQFIRYEVPIPWQNVPKSRKPRRDYGVIL